MQHIAYYSLRLVVGVFRFIPFPVLHFLSDGLAFLLFHVIGYRKKVVLDSLRRSFPEKTEAERLAIARRSYRNLTDVTLETIKEFTLPLDEAYRRCPSRNPELLNQYLDQGKSVILCGSHYSNWEISGLTMPRDFHGATVTAYKPLTNKVIDLYMNEERARGGMEMVSMEGLFGEIRKRRSSPTVFILVADQSPSSHKSAHWVDFLGQDTASLPGTDVLARKFDYPVLYFNVQRLRRGYYEVTFDLLCPTPSEVSEGDISRIYARHLEAIIRAKPEGWLWSHKRWKLKREVKPSEQVA